jgi:hypothetical protein
MFALASALAILCACTSGAEGGRPAQEIETPASAALDSVSTGPSAGACDASDAAACLLPWPNDRFTATDADTETGRRVDLPTEGSSTADAGTAFDPAEWNRADGFASTSVLMTHVANLDPEASQLPPSTDIGASLEPDGPLVLLDASDEGAPRRLAAWAELDAGAATPEEALVMIHPAAALPEGRRIVVALRDLVHRDGEPVRPSEGMRTLIEDPDPLAARMLEVLERAGLEAGEIDVAWTFTVASARSTSGPLRHMWQDLLDEVGADGAPAFTVTGTTDGASSRTIDGTFEVPSYLDDADAADPRLTLGDDGLPASSGTIDVPFTCGVPTGDAAGPAVIVGHGALSSRADARSVGAATAAAGTAACGVDWIGFAADDAAQVPGQLADPHRFGAIPDQLMQAQLHVMALGRLLRSPSGFASDQAFQVDGRPAFDRDQLRYLGISLGGILGGAAAAVSNDWNRSALMVPGIGFNLILPRSTLGEPLIGGLADRYPDRIDQLLLLDLYEQLWQRATTAGYAQHLTEDPFDGNDAEQVLVVEAFSDHQVPNVATEKLARTLGLGRLTPTLAEGRSLDVEPFWGIDPIGRYPHDGSALAVWDFGNAPPPADNRPASDGIDPHTRVLTGRGLIPQVLSFSQDGVLIDVCDGEPCGAG